jgi:hypothetical protein
MPHILLLILHTACSMIITAVAAGYHVMSASYVDIPCDVMCHVCDVMCHVCDVVCATIMSSVDIPLLFQAFYSGT